jgi:hypothetical protein
MIGWKLLHHLGCQPTVVLLKGDKCPVVPQDRSADMIAVGLKLLHGLSDIVVCANHYVLVDINRLAVHSRSFHAAGTDNHLVVIWRPAGEADRHPRTRLIVFAAKDSASDQHARHTGPDVAAGHRVSGHADTGGVESALESARAFKVAPDLSTDEVIIVNQCRRGDKDIFTVADAFSDPAWHAFTIDKAEQYNYLIPPRVCDAKRLYQEKARGQRHPANAPYRHSYCCLASDNTTSWPIPLGRRSTYINLA